MLLPQLHCFQSIDPFWKRINFQWTIQENESQPQNSVVSFYSITALATGLLLWYFFRTHPLWLWSIMEEGGSPTLESTFQMFLGINAAGKVTLPKSFWTRGNLDSYWISLPPSPYGRETKCSWIMAGNGIVRGKGTSTRGPPLVMRCNRTKKPKRCPTRPTFIFREHFVAPSVYRTRYFQTRGGTCYKSFLSRATTICHSDSNIS